MIQRRHMLCTWWLSNIKRKLQNFIDSCLYSLGSGLHYLLQLNLSNFKLPIKKFQMHHAPGCLKLKITLHVYQVLFCNFYSVVLSTVVSAANPFPYVHHNRRKNKQDSLRQLVPNYRFCFSSGCFLGYPQISVLKRGTRGNQDVSPCCHWQRRLQLWRRSWKEQSWCPEGHPSSSSPSPSPSPSSCLRRS